MDRSSDTAPRRASGSPGPEEAGHAAPEGGSGRFEAAVVVPSAGQTATYPMFEAHSVTLEGATLSGGLLLETGEEVTLELRLPDQSAVRTRARVVAIVPGDHAALRVEFVNLGDGDRQRLSRRIAPPAP